MREMYDWALANDKEARTISLGATEYVKKQARPEMMKEMYEKYFVHSLKRVVDAYQPLEREEAKGEMNDWLSKWSLVGKCSGRVEEECEWKNWREDGARDEWFVHDTPG